MTDRELLELAAKAAGYVVRWHDSGYYGPTMEIMEDESGGAPWNPLADDGDALRLAVKLHLRIEINKASIVVFWTSDDDEQSAYEYPTHRQDDDYNIVYSGYEVATRRAIVRAAAEIGKEMK